MAERDIFAPGFKEKPYWWELAEPVARPPQELPSSADVVVVGGGYTGLACALELARRGVSPVVLDAEAIGYNASSRSGGIVVGGLKLAAAALEPQIGPERVKALMAEGVGTLSFLETLIEREGIDCHYRRTGRFFCAYTRKHYDALAAKAPEYAAMTGEPAYAVPRAEQRREIGSDHYRGGLVVEAAGTLHPALYMRGLADAARRAGARLYDRTRVTALVRDGKGWRVSTTTGEIMAREVMIATNGYTGAVTPWMKRRMIPVGSFMIATEELPDDLARELVPNSRGLADTRRVLSYFRRSPDGKRILWGGRVSTGPIDLRTSAQRLFKMMTTVWPQLHDYRVTHSWMGNVSFTFDFMPHLGTHEGMHYAMGCQGAGVAMMTWLGTQAGIKIAGSGNRPSAFDGLAFPTAPLYSGNPWFLPAVLAWYKLRDGMDRRADAA